MKTVYFITLAFCIFSIKSDDDLAALSSNSNAEEMMDQNDSSAIDNAVMRLESLVKRAQRLKQKLIRELTTTVSYLKFHFNQRALFDSKIRKMKDYHDGKGTEVLGGSDKGGEGRKLLQNPKLNFGAIDNNNYNQMNMPMSANMNQTV